MITSDALVLLDTNILIHYIRGNKIAQQIETDYNVRNRSPRPLIAYVSWGEIESLALQLGWESKKIQLMRALCQHLTVVPIDRRQIVEKYAEIDVFSQKKCGSAKNMGKNDLWIAAIAAVTGAYLITTDLDFDHLAGIKINCVKIDPKTGITIQINRI